MGNKAKKEVIINALEEATGILEARIAAVSVEKGDPLHGILTWKNNNLAPANLVLVGYIFGQLVASTFKVATFVYEGISYYWGTIKNTYPPAKGSSKTDDINTYALSLDKTTTLDVLTFIAERGPVHIVTRGYPDLRVMGLKVTDFEALNELAERVFKSLVTVAV